jgi:hypothetical protein
MPPGSRSRPRFRLGCVGALILGLIVVTAVYGLIAPWSFHIGERLTPLTWWWGVGRLHDSSGADYSGTVG